MKRSAIWILLLVGFPSLYLYHKNMDINTIFLSIIPMIYLWALVKNSKYLILLYPFVLIVPFILFYIHYYDTIITEQVLSIVIESNWQETMGFLGANIYYYLIICFLWVSVVTVLFWQNYRIPVIWTHRSRWWFIGGVSSILILTVSANALLNETTEDMVVYQSNDFLVEDKNNFYQEFKNTYPLGLLVSFKDLYKEQVKINTAFAKNKHFSFKAVQPVIKQNKQLIVLVIGETSRRANWQLNGYSRDTNPLLAKQSNLINFSDMIGVSESTRSSIPMLLTRKPAKQVYEYDFPEPSIITAFKEVGFETYWVSNQQKFGSYDTSTSVYAREADYMFFLNKANYYHHGETDEVVLPVFDKIINSDAQKIFVVVHTLGSHYDYSHRYPENYDVFKPSLNDLDKYSLQDKQHKEELINSYDNSILYTDYVLNKLIEKMKMQKDRESFLFYSSDHGEDLFDNNCDKVGHGNETAYNVEIASFAWYSNKFADNNFQKVKSLKMNKNSKVNQTSIFPTLIDAADIKIPKYENGRSILGELSPYQRLILSDKDYDKNKWQGICREIK